MKIKEELHKIWSGFSDLPISLLAGAIVLVIVIVTGLIVLMLWLSARFKFVWLHAVVYNDAAISKPFREYRKEGDSIFKLSLVVGLSVLLVVGALGGWVYGSLVWADFFRLGTSSAAGAIISIIAAVIVFLAMIIFLCIWNVFVEHFVTPIMMLDRQTYLPSWAKFSSIYKNHRKDFWLYLLVFIGLGIVCSILEGIVAIGVIVLGVLAGGIVYGVGYLIFALLLKAKILFIGFAIGAGIPFVIAFVIVVLSIVLPCAVFFRAFALYFLSSLNEGYAPLALKE